ncbi:MAG: MaoC/PaaZ C-terminal domain-containing protein [Myxococcales bacterium]|nr:MaoC/PaaZ C-terminal domain-containing protein [Myxococcales bacterium]
MATAATPNCPGDGPPRCPGTEELDMVLDRASVGTSAHGEQRYTWRDPALYALALGAGREDLGYVLDKPAPKVLPTFGVIPAFDPVFDVLRTTRADLLQLLHTGQRVELLQPFPSEGHMETRAQLRGLWDLKIGALAVVDAETAVDGAPCARTTWELLLRGEGGFGGERPPARLRVRPKKNDSPLFEDTVATRPEQALLYRLTGDINPIHADPEVAAEAGFERPILHGLCTYGIAGRLALKHLAGDDPERFVSLEAQFSAPVVPGDALVIRAFPLEEPGAVALTVGVSGSDVQAISKARFRYRT